jgi:hypothetical protein
VVGRHVLPEHSTLRRGFGLDLVKPLGRAPAHPNEAMMSIQTLHVTGHAIEVFARDGVPPA